MPEHAASDPTATPAPPRPSASGTATPQPPPPATHARTRTRRPAVLDRFRVAVKPLRLVMRRTGRHS